MAADTELDRLRAAVRAADAAILKAIERRSLVVRRIGEVKREAPLALRDFSVERPDVVAFRSLMGGGFANLKFASPPLPALVA